MSKGIVLLAFGKPCYGRAAFNMAVSIKHFSPNVKIALLRDHAAFAKDRIDTSFFDEQIFLEESDLSNPGLIKSKIYKYLPFEHNLYLDVDGCALQSCEPLLDSLVNGKDYYKTKIFIVYDSTSENEFPQMIWANKDTIWNHYQLSDHKLPATQSSIQYIRKCKESEKIFEQWQKNIGENPIPVSELRHTWGGGQPDELYLNVALAQLGIAPDIGMDAMFFGNKNRSKEQLHEIAARCTFLSLYGGRGFINAIYTDWYDKIMIRYLRTFGRNHVFKIPSLYDGKHSNTKQSFFTKKKVVAPVQTIPHKILVKFPTRSRPEKFLKALELMFSKAEDKDNISVLVSYDSDDETMTKEVIEKAELMGNVKCYSGVSNSKVEAINRDMDKAGEWNILMLLSDDMICNLQGWDNVLRQKIGNNTDICLHFFDGFRKDLQTLYVAGRKYYERDNFIYHPAYKSLFCDNHQMLLAKKRLKYRYFNDCLFRHEMAMNGFEQDELHKHTESFWNEDQATFNQFRRRSFRA